MALAALTAGGLCVALPGTASAAITVSGFAVPSTLDQPSPNTGISQVEPAIEPAPDGSNAEWFLVNAQWQDLLSITPTGTMTKVGNGFATDSGPPDKYASVDADGFDWILDNYQGSPEQALYAVGGVGSPHAGVTRVASFNGYSEDMTLSSDGALYIGDNSGNIIQCEITAAPSAQCVPAPITGAFDGGAYAIGSGGDAIWFTDAAGGFGSYSSGVFAGPYWTGGSIDAGTMVTAGNGYVYVAAGAESAGGANTEILYFSIGDPYDVQVAVSGFQDLESLAVGPDGNVWFLDSGANDGAGVVGEMSIANGSVTEFGLPDGYRLPSSGARIAPGPDVPGPGGTGEVFFTATTSDDSAGHAAIGVVSGIPMPVVPGRLALKPTVTVSRQHAATLTLRCTGVSNAECAGKITLDVKAKVKVQRQLRAPRRGVKATFRTVTQTKTLKLGSVTYDIPGGSGLSPTVTLTQAAYDLLEEVSGHRWTATVTNTPSVGSFSGHALKMTGPAPQKTAKATATKKTGGRAARDTWNRTS